MTIEDGTVDAIVVGGVDYGEADRVVHLLTTSGRLAVFAHSAKKSRRRFAGALDPFTTIRASITSSKKRSNTMPTLASASVDRSRLPMRRDLSVIALGSYVTELSFRVAPEGEAADGIYALLEQALEWLCVNDASLAARRTFELRLMDELGYTPLLERCVVCSEETERPHVDFERGGVLCERHAAGSTLTGPKTITWAQAVLVADEFDPDGSLGAEWASRAATKLTSAMGRFFDDLLSRPLKATRLLDDVELN